MFCKLNSFFTPRIYWCPYLCVIYIYIYIYITKLTCGKYWSFIDFLNWTITSGARSCKTFRIYFHPKQHRGRIFLDIYHVSLNFSEGLSFMWSSNCSELTYPVTKQWDKLFDDRSICYVRSFGWPVGFYGISTVVGHLMLNPVYHYEY